MTAAAPAGQLICGNAATVLATWPPDIVDLVVTSPPYDTMRDYSGYDFDAEAILAQLFRVTKPGGVAVWVVGDQVVNGGRTLTSFRHAIAAQSVGWRVHDTMIFRKSNPLFVRGRAYTPTFEFMFVFSRGRPTTFNALRYRAPTPPQKKKMEGHKGTDGRPKTLRLTTSQRYRVRPNVWDYTVGVPGTTDKITFGHPATFPEQLATDHILSWSNPGDLVVDPMVGSGTVPKMAELHGRQWAGIDISEEYLRIAAARIAIVTAEPRLGFA